MIFMHEHHIDDMLSALSPLLGDKQEEAKRILLSYWDNRIAIVWETSDAISSCADFGVTISQEDAESVLQSVFDDHDANYGINNETFYRAACDLIRESESALMPV